MRIKEAGLKKTKKRKKIDLKAEEVIAKKTDRSLSILGVNILGTRKIEVLRKLWLSRKEMLHVATVNPEFVMEARINNRFKSILTQTLSVADGYGVVWAAKILAGRQIERISGTELVELILQHANLSREKIFLLGAAPLVAERAAAAMSRQYPQAVIASFSGASRVALEKDEEASMTIARINAFEPDYLLVAYGSPWQDIWIEDNRPYLRTRVAIGIGGVLDEWAGGVAVCPRWIDQAGFKWLWRFGHEPWRWRRIAKVWQFAALVGIMRLKRSF